MKVESEAVPDSPKEDTNSLSNDNGGNGSGGEQGGAGGSRSADGGRGGGARVLKKGPWTTAEDNILREYVEQNGEGNWNQVQKNSGLFRCGKSCRLRWANHLRPDLKKGQFSSEEQKLIIELHANMGNKWARMAAHLPGRTDNEIKNFWNTRIKRLQRSGAPIYPENVRSQVQHEDLHQNSGELCGKKRPNEFSQGDGFGVPEVIFDNFNYESQFADISLHNLLATNFVAQNSPSIAPTNSVKRLAVAGSLLPGMDCNLSGNQFANEPESALYSTDYDHACDFDSGKAKNLAVPIGDAIAGCHPTLNGNFSTSGSMIRSMKMELPSLQYTNNDPSCNWFDGPSGSPIDQFDSYFQSPAPSASVQSEGISQKNTDLLGALVQEGHGLGGTANSQGSVEVFIPTPMHNQMLQNAELGMCEEQHGGNSEFGFPMGLSAAAVLGECAIGGSSVEEFQTTKSPSSLNDFADTNDLRRSDAFPGSSMLDGSSQELKDQSINDTLAELFHGDSYDEYKLLTAGDLSVSGRQLGLDSFPWKSMPRACHMSDFPENL